MKKCPDCGKHHNKTTKSCSSCYLLKKKYNTLTPNHWEKICSICSLNFTSKNGYKKFCDACKEKYNLKPHIVKNRRAHNQPLDYIPKHKAKNGEGHLAKSGYRYLTKCGHPNCGRYGRILEHIFIMSEHLRRPIRKNEIIHHKNGIKHDNHIDNLELWHKGHPIGQRLEDKLNWAKTLLEEYGYTILCPK